MKVISVTRHEGRAYGEAEGNNKQSQRKKDQKTCKTEDTHRRQKSEKLITEVKATYVESIK